MRARLRDSLPGAVIVAKPAAANGDGRRQPRMKCDERPPSVGGPGPRCGPRVCILRSKIPEPSGSASPCSIPRGTRNAEETSLVAIVSVGMDQVWSVFVPDAIGTMQKHVQKGGAEYSSKVPT